LLQHDRGFPEPELAPSHLVANCLFLLEPEVESVDVEGDGIFHFCHLQEWDDFVHRVS
jgi:hypothetical protein